MTDRNIDRNPALPPAFDAGHYLAANPDLALTIERAAEHYANAGRAEGRIASPLALRENLIALINDGRSVLEIGPFCSPLLRGPNVAYLDVLDADQLRERAVKIGVSPHGCPERVDYVGGLEQVHRRFDAVISSHAVEHQPDLIHHFEQIERILEPDGLFCLIIPDKRYCLDHHIAESTIAGVIQAHHEQRRMHSLASVIEHTALTTHNDSERHWAGDHGPAIPPDRAERVRKSVADFGSANGRYIDVHAWYFTPVSFRAIVDTLGALELTGLELAGVYDTARDRNEFCAVLRLGLEARRRALRGTRKHSTVDVAVPGRVSERPSAADERWEARYAHRTGRQPRLAEALVPAPQPLLAERICTAWAYSGAGISAGAGWATFTAALSRADPDEVAADLAALGRAAIGEGVLGGARQHERASSRAFADRLARWTYDKLVCLAEAIGLFPLENPEDGPWGVNAMADPGELLKKIEEALGADLSPPAHIGGYLGIVDGNGAVHHMRMLDAIYAAWRMRQLGEALGAGLGLQVVEVGAGAGLTAFYAQRLGLSQYRIFDQPPMNAMQAYVLGGAVAQLSLASEPDKPLSIRPISDFDELGMGSADVLFNTDMLPGMGRETAVALLRVARRIGIGHVLSINQEANLRDHVPVGELMREAGGYRLASRHRHWLRAGYAEEHYILAE